jgi:hypothetical protein
MKRVLFWHPKTIWFRQYETALELVENYLQKDYEVIWLSCDAKLETCAANPEHRRSICVRCQSRMRSGMTWARQSPHGSTRVLPFYELTAEQRKVVDELANVNISTREELKQIRVEGSDIGWAALSSVISQLREPKPDLQANIALIRRSLRSAAMVHFSFSNHLRAMQPDECVIYNGRFAEVRPALRAAQSLSVPCYVFEGLAGVIDQYTLTRDSYLHDLNVFKREMEDAYRASPLSDEQKLDIVHDNFRRNRIYWFPTEEMPVNPQLVAPQPRRDFGKPVRVAIYNSSEDEFAAIPGWENPHYADQNDGIEKILQAFEGRDDIQFALRVHPNLSKLDNSQTQFLDGLPARFPKLEYIGSRSPLSSYELMERSDLVLTFGSTIGIDAVYFGKPSILMGTSFYEDLGAQIRPRSHADCVQMIENYIRTGELPSVGDVETALKKYGLFRKAYGFPYHHVKVHWPQNYSMMRAGQEFWVKPGREAEFMAKLSAVFE